MSKLSFETLLFTHKHPYDNARIETFHSILKRAEVYLKPYKTLTEIQAAIGWTINFYNRNRISNVV